MPVITINGPIGCGSVTIGQMVAQKLNIDFVDRLVFTEASKLVHAPVGALIDKEQRVDRFRDRLGRFVHSMLERSALSGDMYAFGVAPPEAYTSVAVAQSARVTGVTDQEFISATTSVVNDLCRKGDVVIIGRGANVILADAPGVLHVGLIAPPEVRSQTLMRWENLEREKAEVFVEELEKARVKFFRKFFQVHPNEPGLYHTILNMGKLEPEKAADIIVQVAQDVTFAHHNYGDAVGASHTAIHGWGEQGKQ